MTPTKQREAAERQNPLNQRAKFAAQRAKIIEVHEKNPEMTIDELAARCQCSRKMVSTTLAEVTK